MSKKLAKVYAEAKRCARTYSDPHGRGTRLNTWAVIHRFRVMWLAARQRLNGVEVIRMKLPDRRGQSEATYLETDVAARLRERFPMKVTGGVWLDLETFRDHAGQVYRTRAAPEGLRNSTDKPFAMGPGDAQVPAHPRLQETSLHQRAGPATNR